MRFRISQWAALFVLCCIAPLSTQAAQPAIGSHTYDVSMVSRALEGATGQFIFSAEGSDEADSGPWSVTLSSGDETTLSAEGNWSSWHLAFFCVWFAAAEADAGGQLYAFGFAWRDWLAGRAAVMGTPDLEPGRYRLWGKVVSEPPAEDPAEEVDGEPVDGEPVDGESSGGEEDDAEEEDGEQVSTEQEGGDEAGD